MCVSPRSTAISAEARDFNAIVGELEAEPGACAGQRSSAPTPERAGYMSEGAAADPDEDLRWMHAALNLGSRSLGLAAPNPAVGAILVKDGAVVGRGATAPGGRPHAERIAIGRAGEAARGATLYVTLEPCSHFGASPPCVRRCHRGGRHPRRLGDGRPESVGGRTRAARG